MLTLHEGLLIAGKFRLLRPLAKGGMGSVWAAKHVSLDVPVAVKFMDPRYADLDDLRARFEREAKAAAQLRMPNVVQILDYGVEHDTPYIVMEFLCGEDLGARLAREGRLSVRDTVAILAQVCKALRRAHDEGIVHRDLKPANIFLIVQDDELLVKVLDFGIAKVLRSDAGGDATKTGDVMGSPAYMSPEQVRGLRQIDHRTDLWSLGVIAYRALTGILPFPGTQAGDMYVRICTDSLVMPTRIVPHLDRSIDVFMEKALAKDSFQRFASAKEMAEALAELDRGKPSSSALLPPVSGTNVDAATNAPVTHHVGDSTRQTPQKKNTFYKRRKLAIMAIAWISIGVPLSLGIVMIRESDEVNGAVPSLSSAVTEPAALMLSATAASAAPIASASSQNVPEPASSTMNSSKATTVPRKTIVAPTPKSSVNYGIRKEL